MMNPLVLNPVSNYQQLLQHVQQQVPVMLKPIEETFRLTSVRIVEEAPHDVSEERNTGIRTLVDYTPWLKHLYSSWQHHLVTRYGVIKTHTKMDSIIWNPEGTARAINDLALSYTGWLWHQQHVPLIQSIDDLTHDWQECWRVTLTEQNAAHTHIGIQQALHIRHVIFISFGLSLVCAWQRFMPRRLNNHNHDTIVVL